MDMGERIEDGSHSKEEERAQEPVGSQGVEPQHEVKDKSNLLWEAQMDWTYIGHGEWVQVDNPQEAKPHGNTLEHEPDWVKSWMGKNIDDIKLHNEVWAGGYPNRWGAKKEVNSKWNLTLIAELLKQYDDKDIVEWIRYGWPAGRLPTLPPPGLSTKNHKGATEHPNDLKNYIIKESKHGAVMGPFRKIPFKENIGVSPLSTRPKKDLQERRVILDLSFPIRNAVNDGIPKDTYLGFEAKLTFPKTDDFACRIFYLGQGCMMFKIDLSRYFRQIPLDPADYSLIGYVINGEIYFDKVLPMELRAAPYIAQCITNAVAYIHRCLGLFLLNYVDDFVGAETRSKIWASYHALTQLLYSLRVDTSKEKLVPPTTRLEFLGITFDSETMTMEISQGKLQDIIKELQGWLYKTQARRKEVESVIGKLQFVAKCVRAGRIFLSRLIQWIRGMDRQASYAIPLEAR